MRGDWAAIIQRLRAAPWIPADESSYRIEGAEAFARLLSVLGTWKLREENPATKLYAVRS